MLRRGAKLRGPKTYHRDENHATRKAKALVPPWDEVTSLLRRKTRQKPYRDGDTCTRRTGVTCRNGTTNHENDGHAPPPSVSPVPLLCVLCPALSCSLCAVLSSPQLPDRR